MLKSKNWIYLDLEKTGCAFLRVKFQKIYPKDYFEITREHQAPLYNYSIPRIITIREPESYYFSLWSYGLEERGGFYEIIKNFYPEKLKSLISEKGNPIFKLDKIAPVNGITDFTAHDAMGDTIATLELAKIIKNKTTNIWAETISNKSQNNLIQYISENPFCYIDSFFGKIKLYFLSFVGEHPLYKWAICFDLQKDPTEVINMSDENFNKYIEKSLESNVNLINKVMKYVIKFKGKQFRPLLCILSARLVGKSNDMTYLSASTVEMLHVATLLHDDVVDKSYIRRGWPTINKIWGNKLSVLIGDYMFSKSSF